MSDGLLRILCENSLGNYRKFIGTATYLLARVTGQELADVDKELFFDVYNPV